MTMTTETLIHKRYLPFTWSQLGEHFAPVKGAESAAWLEAQFGHYRKSATLYAALCGEGEPLDLPIHKVKAQAQIEKDERFWVAATLMAFYHHPERQQMLMMLLRHALGDAPQWDGPSTWEASFTDTTKLYFEANLPSPSAYRSALKRDVGAAHLIPYVLRAAKVTANLEGPTHVDALLLDPTTGCNVLFEAKVLSDCSYQVSFDAVRNQLARNI